MAHFYGSRRWRGIIQGASLTWPLPCVFPAFETNIKVLKRHSGGQTYVGWKTNSFPSRLTPFRVPWGIDCAALWGWKRPGLLTHVRACIIVAKSTLYTVAGVFVIYSHMCLTFDGYLLHTAKRGSFFIFSTVIVMIKLTFSRCKYSKKVTCLLAGFLSRKKGLLSRVSGTTRPKILKWCFFRIPDQKCNNEGFRVRGCYF